MKALPLSDRILFAVASQRHTARSLARLFRQDIQIVYKVLGGLEDQGLVVRDDERPAAVFELTPAASVEYRAGHLVVDLDGRDPRTDDEDDSRCTALTSRGNRCKHGATVGPFLPGCVLEMYAKPGRRLRYGNRKGPRRLGGNGA